jgi:hypothetical protein
MFEEVGIVPFIRNNLTKKMTLFVLLENIRTESFVFSEVSVLFLSFFSLLIFATGVVDMQVNLLRYGHFLFWS